MFFDGRYELALATPQLVAEDASAPRPAHMPLPADQIFNQGEACMTDTCTIAQ